MSNFRYFSFQLLREAQVFIHLFILPNFRCLSSQFPQEAPVPPASDIYAEVSYKKGEFWFGTQKHIFDKLLDNFTSNNIHHQMLLFADKQNFEKNISACRQKHSSANVVGTQKIFLLQNILVCNPKYILWQNILVCRQKTGQANWSRVRLGLAKYW